MRSPGRSRGRLASAAWAWRQRAHTELLYALTDLPIAIAGLGYAVLTLLAGAALLVALVGLPVIAAGLVGARGWGLMERARARWLLGLDVAEPAEPPRPHQFTGWLRAALTDSTGWRAMAYLLVRAPVAAVTSIVAVIFYGGALGAMSYPMWYRGAPMVFGEFLVDTWFRVLVVALIGVGLLAAAPWAVRGPLAVSRLMVRILLGPSRLSARVRALEDARGHAVVASATEMRRIERDLHDGTQARLVTLAMDLGYASELLDALGDDDVVEQLRDTVGSAHRNAKQALVELRDLVRGIHPPALDSGLEAALGNLVEDLSTPVTLQVDLPDRPSPAIETIAYFCVAELLANVAKHSGAGGATVRITGVPGRLLMRVEDDGAGGAAPADGTGLRGLAERVRTVDGGMAIESPAGGPTTVTVELPLRA